MSKEVAKAIADTVRNLIDVHSSQHFIGVWVAAEVSDPLLSKVQSGGTLYRYVPKSTTAVLAAGDKVMLAKGPAIPLTIIGKMQGDITNIP